MLIRIFARQDQIAAFRTRIQVQLSEDMPDRHSRSMDGYFPGRTNIRALVKEHHPCLSHHCIDNVLQGGIIHIEGHRSIERRILRQ